MIKLFLSVASIGAFIFLIVSCGGATSKPTNTTSLKKTDVIRNYADLVLASYQDALSKASALKNAIDEFVANPTEATHLAAKNAWLEARIPYGQTEAFRFYEGPIDNPDTGPEGFLNSWPMDEGHIDYVIGNENGINIINNPSDYPIISQDVLEDVNENGGEKNISVGYHAIEFLLWGQDVSSTSAGARSYTDFVEGASGTNENQARRKQYLAICATALVEHLTYLVNEWSEGNSANYRTSFLALNENAALLKIITGIEVLSFGELASERMNVALVNHDQEDEHSCFSDNTNIDILMNAKGISNVILGKYADGDQITHGDTKLSLYELLKTINSTKAEILKEKVTNTLAVIALIQAPFDQEISQANPEGNARVKAGIDALQELNELITDTKIELGLE